jgi:fatty-acyl-CoA synthase
MLSKDERDSITRVDRKPFASISDIARLEARPYREVVPVETTFDILRRSADLHADRPALTFLETGEPGGPSRTIRYGELLARVTQAASLFRRLGVGPDDAVAILGPNMPETHYALWGAEVAGRACPINNLLNEAHIAELVRAAGAKVVVALGPNPELDVWNRVRSLRKTLDLPVLAIEAGETPEAPSFQQLLDREPDALQFDPQLAPDRIAAYFHTGGTTGAPKLAQHTHANEVHTSWFAPCYYDFDETTVEINGFPLFHVAGAFVYGLACFSVGAHQIVPTLTGMRNATFVRNYWRCCDRYRVTALAGVPTVLATLLGVPRGDADVSSVKLALTGGSPLPTELAQRFEDATGLPVRNILGMTESAGLLSIGPTRAPRVPGSTGLRLPYSEVKAVHWTGTELDFSRDCAPGETGVVVARGPHVGPGYSDARRNGGVFMPEGWLVSGDLGHVDEHGNIFVTGRAKDVIIRGAHNIDPGMIEEAFIADPAVSMCAAVGEPDARAGELPVVFVMLKPGASATRESLLASAVARIAEPPAVPKRVTIVDAIPMTAIGKVYKPALRVRAAETKIAEMLAGIEGAQFQVEGEDAAGATRLRIHVTTARDRTDIERDIRDRLALVALRYELAWK